MGDKRQPKQGEAGPAPAPALHPPRASTPLTSEHRGRASSGRKQKEQKANKRHQYTSGFVCEVFIPGEGKEQSEEPKRLMVREAKEDFPRCALALRVQHRHPRLQCTSTFCRRTTSRLSRALSLQLEVCLGLLHNIQVSQVSQTLVAGGRCCASNKGSTAQTLSPGGEPLGWGVQPKQVLQVVPLPSSEEPEPGTSSQIPEDSPPSVQDCRVPTHRAQQSSEGTVPGGTWVGQHELFSSISPPHTPHSGISQAHSMSDPPGNTC